ncbi:T9SS type A sorting domain-containing protein [Gramella jeungdoensis]|uniref:T9SS type A sorting domain-containing protein n=1 Tax=Gramella jeungdoensis TaxID=708091 RepID=A0ABT0YZK5_9FLAO|nr:T9SS type A sorting domain-containing protein [Gramella jeungdoensis]
MANSSTPNDFVMTDTGFYFSAQDPVYGRELFFSDGTVEGTRMVVDIFEGNRNGHQKNHGILNNKLLFTGSPNFSSSNNLYITDGSEEGTTLLVEDMQILEWLEYNGKIYFSGNFQNTGYKLWVTDGTANGTQLVIDLNSENGGSNPSNFKIFREKIFFTANTVELGREIWYSDGTGEGTEMLKDIGQNGNGVLESPLYVFNNELYFMGKGANNYFQLFKSDGTSDGTYELKTINQRDNATHKLQGVVLNEGFYFKADDGLHGTELWKTDGSEEGTQLVKDIYEGSGSGLPYSGYMGVDLIEFNGKIYFTGSDNIHGDELWQTDGTAEGTSLVKDLSPGSLGTWLPQFYKVDDRLFFVAQASGEPEFSLYEIDQSHSQPERISEEIVPWNYSDVNIEVVGFESKFYYVTKTEKYGNELFRYDPVTGKSSLFKDLNSRYPGFPIGFESINNNLYFSASNHLFLTNGSKENLRKIDKVRSSYYQRQSEKIEFEKMNNELYFNGLSEGSGIELWKTDGTQGGTVMVKDINPGQENSVYEEYFYNNFKAVDGKLFFPADDGEHGLELWITEGTEETTRMVKNINSGSLNSFPSQMVNVGQTVYFKAKDESGPGLWKTEGTTASTSKIINLQDIRLMRAVNDKIIMAADYDNGRNEHHNDLVTSDGTAEGTSLLMSFPNYFDTHARYWANKGDYIYFVQRHPNTLKHSIYKTDGTAEGTVLVYNGDDHENSTPEINWLKVCGNSLYFAIETISPYSGVELWRLDDQGEVEKVSVESNNLKSTLEGIECFDEKLFFADNLRAHELWFHQAGKATTERLDFKVNGSVPDSEFKIWNLTSAGNVLYLIAHTDRYGQELYSLAFGELTSLPDETSNESEEQEVVNYNLFSLQVFAESCAGKNNGKLQIKANETGSYLAVFDGQEIEFDNELSLGSLSPGVYNICVKFGNEFQYYQCYEFTIDDGVSLQGEISAVQERNSKENKFSVIMSNGLAPYTVKLNNQVLGVYYSNEFDLGIKQSGVLEIISSKACEGTLEFQVKADNKIIAYPNPVENILNLVLPQEVSTKLKIEINSSSGQSLENYTIMPNSNAIELNFEHLNPGIYFIKLKGGVNETIKFIKK